MIYHHGYNQAYRRHMLVQDFNYFFAEFCEKPCLEKYLDCIMMAREGYYGIYASKEEVLYYVNAVNAVWEEVQ